MSDAAQEVRVLSVRQPWALLLAFGLKQYETRDWRTHYRGPLAIHASASVRRADEEAFYRNPELRWACTRLGYGSFGVLPRGVLLAVGTLAEVAATEALDVSARERALGDWTPGRWAWRLEQVRRLHVRVPVRGHLGLWRYDLPEEAWR
jgi:hypothetical protein